MQPRLVPVETVVVPSEAVDVTVEAVGTLEADQAVELRAKRPGHLREVKFLEGSGVREGDVLFLLDDRDVRARLDLARAALGDAEVRERDARRTFGRTETLRRDGVASVQNRDDAEASLARATAGVEVARASLAVAAAELDDTVIRAPFTGVAGRRRVDRGAYVQEGEVLGSLVDFDPLEAVFAVPERYAADLREGQGTDVRVASHADLTFAGAVTFLDPRVDDANRTITVKAAVPNSEMTLRPGQFARIRLHLDRRPGQAVVPEEAVVASTDGTIVYVVADGQASARSVTTGVRTRGMVEILSGLAAGERVVRTGHEKLRRDAPVGVEEVAVGSDAIGPTASGS